MTKTKPAGFVSFDASREDGDLAYKIAARAARMAYEAGGRYDLIDAQMDIIATHVNGNPLKLQELLEADDMNFSHDAFGIRRHINRDTGKLTQHFLPRYTDTEKLKELEAAE